ESARAGTMLMACWLLFPFGALAAVSLFKPVFVERYLLMCVPAVLLLAGFAIDRLLASNVASIKWVGGTSACLVFGLTAWSSFAQYSTSVSKANSFRDMTSYVLSRQHPGDAAIFFTAQTHMS